MDNEKENLSGHITPILLGQAMEATVQSGFVDTKTTLEFPAGTSTDSVVGDSTNLSLLGTNVEPDQLIVVKEVIERADGWGKSGHDVEVTIGFGGFSFSFRSKKDPKKTTKTKTVGRYDLSK